MADPTKSASVTITIVDVTVSVSPSNVEVAVGLSQQFTATVTGSNTSVNWTVSGQGCSAATCGNVSSAGLYTAPLSIPNPATVTITATSAADATKSASVTVTIIGAVSVSISPNSNVSLEIGFGQQFAATVIGSGNTSVNWTVSGSGCTGVACGMISNSGLYTAPQTVPSPPMVLVTATSLADNTKSASVTVAIFSNITVSVSPNSNVSVGVTLTQQFTAAVSGSSNTAVTWTVAGSGCSGASCGTINASGLYTAPTTVPNPNTVTVTATSAADSSKSAAANATVIDISVTVSPTAAVVALNATQQFNATAFPANAPQTVTWTVAAGGNGTTCSGAACGTISASGLYTAPGTLPAGNPVTITVTATSTIDPVGTKNATVTLVSSLNNRLNGTYAFHFSGSDSVGAVISAGNVKADGGGNITSGLVDMTRSTGPQSLTINSGAYVVGSDGRGWMSLITASDTFCYSFALGANGETAFVEFDQITANNVTVCNAAGMGVGVRGSGILDVVPNPSSLFKNSALTGPFVFGLYGEDLSGNKVGYAGVLAGDGAGTVSSGQVDINDAGSALNVPSFTGTYSIAATGRGTMTINPPSATPLNFAFYVVGPSELFFVSTDPVTTNPRVGGLAIGQDTTKTFDNTVFNGTSVFNLTGVDSTGNFSNVAAGLATTDGAGNVTGVFDENNAGAVTANGNYSGTYSAATGGRYTIQILGQTFVLYAVTTNKGFLLDQASTSVLNGFIEPQTNAPFTNASIQGTFAAITSSVANTTAEDIVAALSFNSNGMVSGTQDQTDSTGENPNQAITGTYSLSSNGRGTMTFTAPAARNRVIYVIDNSDFIALGVDSGDKSATVISAEK